MKKRAISMTLAALLAAALVAGCGSDAATGSTQSAAQDIVLPSRHGYQIEIVDTWNMERRTLDGEYQGVCEVPLEGKPYMAVFARKIRATPLPEKFDPPAGSQTLSRRKKYLPPAYKNAPSGRQHLCPV